MMTSAMMMERSGVSFSSMTPASMTAPAMPTAANWCVLPRCEIKVEKCPGGLKMTCKCDDEVACGTLQNLCRMMAGGMCSCCCTLNGITVCQCNLAMGICKCECTKDGVCITCTSGDKQCCDMLQACCDCLSCCLKSGCCCVVSFGGTAVCCGNC